MFVTGRLKRIMSRSGTYVISASVRCCDGRKKEAREREREIV